MRDAGEAAGTWNCSRTCRSPRLLRSERAGRRGDPAGARSEPAAARSERAAGSAAGEQLGFTNSDLAFSGNHLFIGNYHGFNTYDIERPGKPKLIASVVCPGGQGDVSVHGNLLFMSVEQTRGRLDCGVAGRAGHGQRRALPRRPHLRHQRLNNPKQVAAVQTCRGSHTHTLVTDPNDKANLYVYGSGTGTVRSAEELAGCSGLKPEEDPNTALFSIDVIQVPLAAPEKAQIVNRPRIFADATTGASPVSGRAAITGRHAEDRVTNQCHDITVFPEIGLAAGACSGNGILLDISDPKNPVRLDHVSRQELRLLALGDVQQRRHQGDLHRRVGRRRAAALPRDRSADLGRRRDLRHRRHRS